MATVSDVEKYHSQSWTGLDGAKKDELLQTAQNLMDNQFSGEVARLPKVKGDRDDAEKWLAAHFFDLAVGGEVSTESSGGSQATYNVPTGDILQSLTETKYGRQFRELYLFDEQGIGVVMTR